MIVVLRSLVFLCVISLLPIPPFADNRTTGPGALQNNPKEDAIRSPTPTVLGQAQSVARQRDSYEALLHSQSWAVQRKALTVILSDPQKYVPRIQQSLQDYPRLLRTDRVAANRAVYISALVRDPSFPPILVRHLGASDVLEECVYACPIVFALSIQACFADWNPPPNLDSRLATVYDLRETIKRLPRISLRSRPIEGVVRGPALEEHRKEIEGKTEEQLIRMAGPMTSSMETRLFAAFRLETVVSRSKNRLDLYLLALNDLQQDASGEYRGAVYESIYRAELAKARGH